MGRESKGAPEAVTPTLAGPAEFATTHWSIVLAAAGERAPEAAAALETLCRLYWYPLYAYARRRGYNAHDAQDQTQDFFARFLRKDHLGQINPAKGKLRSYLLAAFDHFLANQWDRARAVKRGGRITFLPLDHESAEQRLAQASMEHSPDRIFERSWALALLQQVLDRLREERKRVGQANHFEALKVFLTGEKPPISYAELSGKLGPDEAALRKEVQRLRHRFGELLREEIARTVASPLEIQEELGHLYAVLSA